MYPELQEFLKKMEELLDLNNYEMSEVENILWLTFQAGYDEGFEDASP